jgi:hypothetical protein
MGVGFQRITHSKLLLGEGEEESRFFGALLKHIDLTGIQVAQTGGKGERMHRFLKTLPSLPGFSLLSSLGVARDADHDTAAAFQSVCDGLRSADLDAPSGPGIWTSGPLRIGVFILPDCTSEGMLETLCLKSVANDQAMRCVEGYFECVQREADRMPGNMWKARTHAWLSSQVIPDKRLGEAAEAGYWPFDAPAFIELRGFLQQL